MYAAITSLKFHPGKAEAAVELFGSLVMPAYAQHVARGAWIFTRPEDNRAIAIVLYNTKEAAEAGVEKQAVMEVMNAHGDLLAEPPRREVFHVAMGTVSGAPDPASPSSDGLPPLGNDILSLLADVSRSL